MTAAALEQTFRVKLNRPQRRALAAIKPGRTVTLAFGRGVGKSHLLRVLWWMLVAQYDGTRIPGSPRTGVRIIVFCPTLKQFKDIHAADVVRDLEGDWAWLGGKIDRTTWTITFPGGSWIKPFPAAEHSSKRALGMRCDVICLDEEDDIDIDVFDTVAVPFLSEPCSLAIVVGAGTPRRGRHGLHYRQYRNGKLGEKLRRGETVDAPPELAEQLKSFYSIFATYETVPETVSPRAVARAKATMPTATFEREWRHNFDAGEGLVYQFDESFHVRIPPEGTRFDEFHVGMDHGTVDAGVLLRGGVLGHGNDATVWILDEYYEAGIPNHIWDQRAVAWKGAKFWPDTSRADRVQDLRGMGLDVGETDRGPGSILAGIARVADLLHIRVREEMGPAFQPILTRYARLYVHPRCVNLIREFGLYRWVKRPDGTFDEKPEDRNNHAQDSLRYLCIGRFGRMPNHRYETPR